MSRDVSSKRWVPTVQKTLLQQEETTQRPKIEERVTLLSKFRHKKLPSTWRDFFHLLVLLWYCPLSGGRDHYQNMLLASENSLNMHYYRAVGINRGFRARLQTFLFRFLLAHTSTRKHCMTTCLSFGGSVAVKVHKKLVIFFFLMTSWCTLCSLPVLLVQQRQGETENKSKDKSYPELVLSASRTPHR